MKFEIKTKIINSALDETDNSKYKETSSQYQYQQQKKTGISKFIIHFIITRNNILEQHTVHYILHWTENVYIFKI